MAANTGCIGDGLIPDSVGKGLPTYDRGDASSAMTGHMDGEAIPGGTQA